MARPKNPDALTPAERTRQWRAARKQRGGRELNVSLTPENATKLDHMAAERGEGTSISGLINEIVARVPLSRKASKKAAKDPSD